MYAYGKVMKNLGLLLGYTEKYWFRYQIPRARDSRLISLSRRTKLFASTLLSIVLANNLWHL